MADSEPSPKARSARRLGLRSEAVILLPIGTLVLVLLSGFTLASYRGAIRQLADERRQEAIRLARELAVLAAANPQSSLDDLRHLAPNARAAVIADDTGAALASFGELAGASALAPLGGVYPRAAVALGPSSDLPGLIVAYAPFGNAQAKRFVRLDLAALGLDAQRRALVPLTAVVIAIDLGLSILLLAFMVRALRPFDSLVAQARAVGGESTGDDADFLIAAFERALQAQARVGLPTVEEDIAALQRALAPSLESGLLLLDHAGNVLALNPVGMALLGLEQPPIGQPLDSAFAPQRELVALLRSAVHSGQAVQRAEVTVRRSVPALEESGAGVLVLGLTVHPLRNDGRTARGFLMLFADLTQVRRREEEARLAQSLDRIGELTAGLAHELRNSLATLRGYLTLIARNPGSEEVGGYLGEVRQETDQLQRVLEDFLAFARPGSTRVEEVDFARVLERAANDPALGGAAIELDLPRERPVRLRGDPQLLERAVRNLLHNAVQAEAAEPPPIPGLVARLRSTPAGLELEILDRGPGIPDAVRERLFHPFASGRVGGVGLGLALAQRILALHGGSIRIDARAGGGTRVVVDFPTPAAA